VAVEKRAGKLKEPNKNTRRVGKVRVGFPVDRIHDFTQQLEQRGLAFLGDFFDLAGREKELTEHQNESRALRGRENGKGSENLETG